ncbi:hypothetical protein E2562_018360 [Oryza meyeriana var. granulata]|uniref:Uncharacterized protein n=1 Tax=Oryza meyeriana var. granulata TaxID=110450 RepID=A0A6G1D594_9ORYZ|nr:hypothetical protein E2562_018360 [Oryza meyeriana var. granulata]
MDQWLGGNSTALQVSSAAIVAKKTEGEDLQVIWQSLPIAWAVARYIKGQLEELAARAGPEYR